MLNIVFSSTRQWNPGDEFILRGIRNLLNELSIDYNAILYNRNPDIRNEHINAIQNIATVEDAMTFHVKTAMKDNSIKPWQSYEQVDAIVFAGTPDWQSERSKELYIKAVTHHVPVFFIGIDFAWNEKSRLLKSVLKKAGLLIVRNGEILDSFRENGIDAQCMVCPSLFSSMREKEITKVNTIGLIYRAKEDCLTQGNGWSEEKYTEQIYLYKRIEARYENCRIIIICHYADELFLAQDDFPNLEVKYDFDSSAYYDIYAECDLIIGSRIHGIGLASSLGIPSVPLKFDNRAETMSLFYPQSGEYKTCCFGKELSDIEWMVNNIAKLNKELINYKSECKKEYLRLLKDRFTVGSVNYEYTYLSLGNEYWKLVRKALLNVDRFTDDINKELAVAGALNSLNAVIAGKKIIIKGAGAHTKRMVPLLDKTATIVAITDREVRSFGNYVCISDEDIPNFKFDFVLISSLQYEDEMIRDMEKYCEDRKILSLYEILRDNYRNLKLEKEFYLYL